MSSLAIHDIITYAFSGSALIVSIVLPLYLAKRAEKHAKLEKDSEKLAPFYRRVKEFTEGFNTPGVGYQIKDIYDLSNEASQLGLSQFQDELTGLWQDIEKHHSIPADEQGNWNKQGKYKLNPHFTALGKKIRGRVRVIHDMAVYENDELHSHK